MRQPCARQPPWPLPGRVPIRRAAAGSGPCLRATCKHCLTTPVHAPQADDRLGQRRKRWGRRGMGVGMGMGMEVEVELLSQPLALAPPVREQGP